MCVCVFYFFLNWNLNFKVVENFQSLREGEEESIEWRCAKVGLKETYFRNGWKRLQHLALVAFEFTQSRTSFFGGGGEETFDIGSIQHGHIAMLVKFVQFCVLISCAQ